jgi:tRNA threonylcarbamoyladenosine biosynthesis protein TsaB
MPLILSLDTSTTVCSVAIHNGGTLLGSAHIQEGQAHAEKLGPLIKQVLENSAVQVETLKAIAICSGPGSYTGLRIGTSTAKGLCYSLNIPLISLDVLRVLASAVTKSGVAQSILCPMLDARRMEVYCALFDKTLKLLSGIEAKVVDESSFSEILNNQKVIFFGSGADKCKPVLRHPNAFFLNNIYPSAVELGELAWQKFRDGKFEDTIHFEPLYLKEFLIKKSSKIDPVLNK